jgi:recombination protein RecT
MTTEIQPAPTKALTIRDRLEGDSFRQAVAAALPKHLTPERFIRVAITAITRTPKLAQCDQASFFGALLTLSQYGIEPDGRRAHLIPFENRKRGVTECQLIIDYKGLAELAMRSGLVSYLHADTVCEADQFEVNLGEITKHVIDYRKPRGEVYAAYAVCRFKDGATKAEVMTREEVEAIRKRSRAGTSGPWVTDWAEMAKKTAFRRLSKWLPLSADLRQAIEVDDDQFADMKRANLTATDTPMNPFALPAEAVADEVEVVEGGAQ